jgi:hypothetical protein
MALKFSPADTPLSDLKLWHAESSDHLFAISHESRNRPGVPGIYCFVATETQRSGCCGRRFTFCNI